MLKKKKIQEEPLSPEVQEQQEISEEIKNVNNASQKHKDDLEDQVLEEPETSEDDKLKAEIAEWNNKYLRLYAEFDNYKRRTIKERIEMQQTAGKDVIVDLLPVLDDFERAMKVMETATDVNAVKEGVSLIYSKMKNILAQKGLKEMEAKGLPFDADLHEGITSIPAPDENLKGKILDELERGYYLNDKVIRFAKVIIGA
ncbi:nucleotide exchange factor GrpE [Flavihumibacter sp. R14]|nr:nucleotide exchange factor GrpE [Flavihumibacter soli]